MSDWHEPTDPTPRAAMFGRIVFCVVGSIFLLIGGIYAYFNPHEQVVLVAAILGVGLLLIWLGLSLPPKAVAHFGYWLPWFLPNE